MTVIETQEAIVELLLNIKRDGMASMVDYLFGEGYFTSPASTRFHGACKGGLAAHSFLVYNSMINLPFNVLTLDQDTTAGKKPLPITPHGVAIAALLHDVCKVGAYIPTPEAKNPYRWNKEQPEGHAALSIERIKTYIKMEPIEELMILFHPGVWGTYEYYDKGSWEYNTQAEYHVRNVGKKPKNPTPEEKKADQLARYGKSLRNAIYHNPIVYWFHVADMIAMTTEKMQERAHAV